MDEYLGEASFKADFSVIEPEKAENLGNGSGAKQQVIQREHAEEETHGLMKIGVHLDDEHSSPSEPVGRPGKRGWRSRHEPPLVLEFQGEGK